MNVGVMHKWCLATDSDAAFMNSKLTWHADVLSYCVRKDTVSVRINTV